jgi:hypothetical protein
MTQILCRSCIQHCIIANFKIKHKDAVVTNFILLTQQFLRENEEIE